MDISGLAGKKKIPKRFHTSTWAQRRPPNANQFSQWIDACRAMANVHAVSSTEFKCFVFFSLLLLLPFVAFYFYYTYVVACCCERSIITIMNEKTTRWWFLFRFRALFWCCAETNKYRATAQQPQPLRHTASIIIITYLRGYKYCNLISIYNNNEFCVCIVMRQLKADRKSTQLDTHSELWPLARCADLIVRIWRNCAAAAFEPFRVSVRAILSRV